MKRANCFRGMLSAIALLMLSSAQLYAAEDSVVKLLPAVQCSDGWTMTEKPLIYTKDNLFERINGEAEIYFPFGFELMASARYQSRENPAVAIDADIYKMGSLLDAFGIYAGYRRSDDPSAGIGADSTLSPSLLLFYQDRYFVRMQVTGALEADKKVLTACAASVSKNIGLNTGAPRELAAFMIPEVEKKSERYVKGLLGYEFLRGGIIADARAGQEQMQLFIVYDESPAAARNTFAQYVAYLKNSGIAVAVTEKDGTSSFTAKEPLYSRIFLKQSGRYLLGAVRFSNNESAIKLEEKMEQQLK